MTDLLDAEPVTWDTYDLVIDPDRYAEIELSSGGHGTREQGMCLMEAAAYLAGEQHTSTPLCVALPLRSFGMSLNDSLPHERRQELKALIPALIGTAGDGLDGPRAYMAVDWLLRTWFPTWLEQIPSRRHAAAQLRSIEPVRDAKAVERGIFELRYSAHDLGPEVTPWSSFFTSGLRPAGLSACTYVAEATGVFDHLAASKLLRAGETLAYAASRRVGEVATAAMVETLEASALDLYRDMIKDPR